MNVFEETAVEQAISAMALREERVGLAECAFRKFKAGRLDDYLNVNYRDKPFTVPTYRLDKQIWMSLTPMEIQSVAVPIARAIRYRRVVTLGLGMGYFALMVARHPNVKEVVVYEQSKDCIALFNALHSDKPEYQKLRLVWGDARELFMGQEEEFVYSDIYQVLLAEETLSDAKFFRKENTIKEYRCWGQELAAYVAWMAQGKAAIVNYPYAYTPEDLQLFIDHVKYEGSAMRPPINNIDFSLQLLEALA